MLKTIAILLNIIFLGWFLYMSIEEGFGGMEGWEILLIPLFLLVPIINILALTLGKDNWITLYLKRKAMEEKKKISELEDKTK